MVFLLIGMETWILEGFERKNKNTYSNNMNNFTIRHRDQSNLFSLEFNSIEH